MPKNVKKEMDQQAEESIPKTLRDYLAPLNFFVLPTVAVIVWFWVIPWLKSLGLMSSYTVVWYLCMTTLSVFFAIWLFQHLDEWFNGLRNRKVQAKKIELALLQQQEGKDEK